jgi:hypothetical protein
MDGFHSGLFLREIDSEKLIEETLHCPYLNRNWRIKSRLLRQAGGWNLLTAIKIYGLNIVGWR